MIFLQRITIVFSMLITSSTVVAHTHSVENHGLMNGLFHPFTSLEHVSVLLMFGFLATLLFLKKTSVNGLVLLLGAFIFSFLHGATYGLSAYMTEIMWLTGMLISAVLIMGCAMLLMTKLTDEESLHKVVQLQGVLVIMSGIAFTVG